MTRREFRTLSEPSVVSEALASLDIAGDAEAVPLLDAHGRMLSDRIDAPIDVPGFDRAAMDGFAVRASDTTATSEASPVTLPVRGTVHAGSPPGVDVAPETAVGIATGAVMPDGADAVIPVEETREEGDDVAITTAVTPGANVMPRGADIASGDRALSPGTRLDSRHIGLLAALGTEEVAVRSSPAVGVVATGEELIQPGTPLDPGAGQIYDVNSHSIASAVAAAGGEPTVFEAASDDPAELRDALERAAGQTDLLVTSGSTSAGSADVLYDLVESHGEKLVHGVSLKPGRPMLVGRIFDTPYVGLPGYPVSALTVFRTFVAPRLREAAGAPEPPSATVDATLRTRVHYEGGRLRLLAVGLVDDGDGSLIAYAPSKGSGATTSLVETDGVVRMQPETSLLRPGTDVEVERFDATGALPSLLGVGEPDPVVYDFLDDIEAARYLTLGTETNARWFDREIPDVLVTAGPESSSGAGGQSDGEEIAAWQREWGLAVTAESAERIGGIVDLPGRGQRFANLDAALSLRDAFDRALRDQVGSGAAESIDGYHRGLPGIGSAARAVAAGRADAGLSLRGTAEELDLEFVPVDRQRVTVVANSDRRGEAGVRALEESLSQQLEGRLDDTPGYTPDEE